MEGAIPRLTHMLFQGMFFIITPALICGAFAERMKFSTMVVFMILWSTIVYCPLAHWVWDGGILGYVKVASDATSFQLKSYSASPPDSLFRLPPGAKVTKPKQGT